MAPTHSSGFALVRSDIFSCMRKWWIYLTTYSHVVYQKRISWNRKFVVRRLIDYLTNYLLWFVQQIWNFIAPYIAAFNWLNTVQSPIFYGFLEPIGGSAPKFSSVAIEQILGTGSEPISLTCPAQGSPSPAFRYLLMRRKSFLCRANWWLGTKVFLWSDRKCVRSRFFSICFIMLSPGVSHTSI